NLTPHRERGMWVPKWPSFVLEGPHILGVVPT
ncbi:hypothetical protein KIPB_016563, partial [Kipferlia bialata]